MLTINIIRPIHGTGTQWFQLLGTVTTNCITISDDSIEQAFIEFLKNATTEGVHNPNIAKDGQSVYDAFNIHNTNPRFGWAHSGENTELTVNDLHRQVIYDLLSVFAKYKNVPSNTIVFTHPLISKTIQLIANTRKISYPSGHRQFGSITMPIDYFKTLNTAQLNDVQYLGFKPETYPEYKIQYSQEFGNHCNVKLSNQYMNILKSIPENVRQTFDNFQILKLSQEKIAMNTGAGTPGIQIIIQDASNVLICNNKTADRLNNAVVFLKRSIDAVRDMLCSMDNTVENIFSFTI